VDCFDYCFVGFVDEINHFDAIVVSDQEDVRSTARGDLHCFDLTVDLDALDDLMELEIANENVAGLANITEVAGKVIV
jgi:hypothetical protein